MVIDGRELAEHMYAELKERVVSIQNKGITPHLAVLLVGENPASLAYIAQKKTHAERINARVTIIKFPLDTTTDILKETLEKLNNDPSVHAILVQKPLPPQIDEHVIDEAIIPEKDVDGFNHASSFILALPLAVGTILEHIHSIQSKQTPFVDWLKSKNIAILGKGPTAGGPTIQYFHKLGLEPIVIDSKTKQKERTLKEADIIISAVGKEKTIIADYLKKGVILIGVGIHGGADKKIHGDYVVDEIKDIAGYYTPTPRGVGPVNVACLMKNVIAAAEQQTK